LTQAVAALQADFGLPRDFLSERCLLLHLNDYLALNLDRRDA
jgi:hypothetical protein